MSAESRGQLADISSGTEPNLASAPRPIRERSRLVRRLRRNRSARVAVVVLVIIVLIAVLGPICAPYDPNKLSYTELNLGPSRDHWFGTDNLGRDYFSRLLYATGTSLLAGLGAVLVSMLLGIPAGLRAGFRGGRFDKIGGIISDTLMAMPGLVLALAIVAILGPGLRNAMLAIGILTAPRLYRVTRGAAIAVKDQIYIDAARTVGCSERRLIVRHLLPNCLTSIIVQVTFLIGAAVTAEAGLSFLGLGVIPPGVSWGTLLGSAFDNIRSQQFPILPPAIMISATVLALSTLGDAIRDALGRTVSKND